MSASAEKYFTASSAFAATGLRAGKRYQWIDRGITIPSKKDKLPSGSGDPHLMSINTILQIAITVELVRLRVVPKDAARPNVICSNRANASQEQIDRDRNGRIRYHVAGREQPSEKCGVGIYSKDRRAI
jgi:hypothetical protein